MSTCIITGAGSGIGRASAIEIGKTCEYDNIVLIGRTEQTLYETAKMMEDGACNVVCVAFDLSRLEKIPELVQTIYKKCGSIDCLINIAGYTDPQPLLTTSIENMTTTYSVNVFAPFVLTRECVRFMKSNCTTAKILNVASTAGITPRPGWLSYASSKAAVVAMSQTLSEELSEYGIKVYCVSPGRCATALRRKLAPDEDQSKIMQPEEVGHIIANLISKEEHCLDGQNIVIRKK